MAALTSATSAETPNTPTTLADCATGSTVVWLIPSRSQGNPDQKYVRPNSVVTQIAGASMTLRGPNLEFSHASASAKSPGKSARYAMSNAAARTATGQLRPPNVRMVVPVQYTVPPKYPAPVITPRANARWG